MLKYGQNTLNLPETLITNVLFVSSKADWSFPNLFACERLRDGVKKCLPLPRNQ